MSLVEDGKVMKTVNDFPGLHSLNGICALGGGHGLGRVLSSLSFLENRLTGIVATTDSGGSTGRIRNQAGGIAWGDLRNCINQLITTPTLGSLLFDYRFADAGELSDHNLGNLILLALDQISPRPLHAVELIRELLDVRAQLMPMAETPTTLVAHDGNGGCFQGEVAVAGMDVMPTRLYLEPSVEAPPEAVAAIAQAELLLLSPGSLITSLMPNLLVDDLRTAIEQSKAPRVLLGNLQAEPGAVGNLSLAEQLTWMQEILDVSLVDAVIWPDTRSVPEVDDVAVYVADLSPAAGGRMHDRDKLAAALERLLPQLKRLKHPIGHDKRREEGA